MRTTVDIDEDVLLAAKEIAKQKGISMGRVISDLARESLVRETVASMRNEVPLFPRQANASVVTMELVNKLRDEQG